VRARAPAKGVAVGGVAGYRCVLTRNDVIFVKRDASGSRDPFGEAKEEEEWGEIEELFEELLDASRASRREN